MRFAANYYLAPPDMTPEVFSGHAAEAGADGIAFTVAALDQRGPQGLARIAADHGLFVSTLNSAGYFLHPDAVAARRQADQNRRLLEAAVRIGAQRLVVITGGISESGLTLEEARRRVAEQLALLDAEACLAGVRLALEPVHPVDLTNKGCVNSIGQALEMVRPLQATDLVVDTFHSAWDPDLWRLPQCVHPHLAVVQVCNWFEPSAERKPERDLPLSGGMDLAAWLRHLVEAGYCGPVEFEMFDQHRRGRSVPTLLHQAIAELKVMCAGAQAPTS